MAEDEIERIAAKLDEIQQQVGKLQASRSWFERHAFVLAPAVTLIIFVLGLAFKDWVDQELRERQFRLSGAQAVQNHIQALAAREAHEPQLTAIAVALAEFGEVAVAPLVRHLRLRGEANRGAAMEGIRTSALLAREQTCDELGHLLERDRLDYPWWSQASAAELLADLRCRDGLAALNRFENGHLAALRSGETLLQSELLTLERAVRQARRRLERARR